MPALAEEPQRLVDEWVADRFDELGFDEDETRLLVCAGADWHTAQVMLVAGCDRDTCLWILV